MDNAHIDRIIMDERAGKMAAIHAYDKMMWTVRSGYLALVFGGWSFVIKAAVENHVDMHAIKPYIILMAMFSLALAIGAFYIDRNYARRKFRVINAIDELVELDFSGLKQQAPADYRAKLLSLLKISGDAANKSYLSKAFTNELTVSRIIYLVSAVVFLGVTVYSIV